MTNRVGLQTVVLMVGVLTADPGAFARQRPTAPTPQVAAPGCEGAIRTERLTPGQHRIWEEIQNIVYAADPHGKPLHPTLQSLWRSVDTSGSTVYVEMSKGSASYKAGVILVEPQAPGEAQRTLSIQLFLDVIDRATVCELARRADGFLPFEGLNKHKRYTEVLAHELAHALCAIRDSDYFNMLVEQNRLSRDLTSLLHGEAARLSTRSSAASLMEKLEALSRRVEIEPDRTEAEVWRELAANPRSSLGRTNKTH